VKDEKDTINLEDTAEIILHAASIVCDFFNTAIERIVEVYESPSVQMIVGNVFENMDESVEC